MPKFRVLTPKGASFTVAGGGYDFESEALDPIEAEIIEAPANEAEFIAARKNRGCHLCQGHADHQDDHRRAGELQGHHARLASASTAST